LAIVEQSRLEDFLAILDKHRARVLVLTGALIAVIAFCDWLVFPDIAVGTLYVFPILLVAIHLRPRQIAVLAASCSYLRELFNPIHWQSGFGLRLVSWFFAFFAMGFFVSELARNRKLILQRSREVQQQSRMREQAEHQMRILIETSPLAILTLDEDGTVQLFNESAQRLFGSPSLATEKISAYLPVLARPLAFKTPVPLRSKAECRGQRRNGEVFLAHIWFSTYDTTEGRRLAAVVWDASESLRDREDAALSNTMETSRIMIGAFSHEVQNLSKAAGSAWESLARIPSVTGSRDYQSLGTLVTALDRISHVGLRMATQHATPVADLNTVLDETLIVIGPSFEQAGIEICWRISNGLPLIQADHYSLLQVFLNLANNSRRAMLDGKEKQLFVEARQEGSLVLVQFRDTGHGVRKPDVLFQPFHPGAEANGLGLYVCRQILSSNGGDLRYEPQDSGSCFVVELLGTHGSVFA
jgi:two-component system sensor kinase FixL